MDQPDIHILQVPRLDQQRDRSRNRGLTTMNWLLAMECFAIGALGALVMFLIVCFIPEIEDFFKNEK